MGMGMSNSSALTDTLRTVVLVVLAFFVSLILVDTIFEVIFATVIFYLFWFYYRKSKMLKRQLDEAGAGKARPSSASPEGALPPSSTDA